MSRGSVEELTRTDLKQVIACVAAAVALIDRAEDTDIRAEAITARADALAQVALARRFLEDIQVRHRVPLHEHTWEPVAEAAPGRVSCECGATGVIINGRLRRTSYIRMR